MPVSDGISSRSRDIIVFFIFSSFQISDNPIQKQTKVSGLAIKHTQLDLLFTKLELGKQFRRIL
jgi:hypothetical protein